MPLQCVLPPPLAHYYQMLRQERPSGICLQSSSPEGRVGEKNAPGGLKIRRCRSMPGSLLSPRGYNCAALQSTGAPELGPFCTRAVSPFEVSYSGVKCCSMPGSQQQEWAWLSNLMADAVAQGSRVQISGGCGGMRWTAVQRKSPKTCYVSTGSAPLHFIL